MVQPLINMQLTGKILFKLDSNSSLLLKYGRYCLNAITKFNWVSYNYYSLYKHMNVVLQFVSLTFTVT